ncbi:MAG TPA: DoxX family protein [Polyangia bacterium]|jgi:uncharacterized membrane protein YphA (DoxX/SURF4 family)|nr:DoxX family protein [Polyangia bacterium]
MTMQTLTEYRDETHPGARPGRFDRSKLETIGYWVTTGLIAAVLLFGGAVDVAHPPSAVAFLAHLGYPAYFAILIGTWKVLGGIALLAPRWPRLKEWAYAGVFFDLTGAAISHAASGDPAPRVLVPLVMTALALASWTLRPQSRKLGIVRD